MKSTMKEWTHQKGSKGQEVKRIQSNLGNLTVDGKFGPLTEAAVKDFQSKNKLTVDGKFGNFERRILEIDIYPGIDVSKWNGIVDWDKLVTTDLVKFCWAKITEGNDHIHPGHERNISEARRVGIPVGGYHFSRPDLHKDPHQEVKNFLKHCPLAPGDLRPALDFERSGEHSPGSIRQWVLTFLEEIESQSGVRPIIYTGGNMTKYALRSDTTGLDDYTLWHASYSKKAAKNGIKKDRLAGWTEWRVWQWTGSGVLSGISGKVDRNWLVGGQPGFEEVTIT